MARYFAKPARVKSEADYWPEPPLMTSIDVCDHEAVDTGLLDADGNAIWRAPNPIGFGRDSEW